MSQQQSDSPAVSVIIATYNSSATLRCAIETVLWQTFDDFELLVIGDACTDDSQEVVESFGDPRVHWHNLPVNSGYQSAPTNEGLRRARGRWIAYLNHDDLWFPNHLETLTEWLEKTGADIVTSIMECMTRRPDPFPIIPNYPRSHVLPEISSTMHRRELLDEIGYWKTPDQTWYIPRVEWLLRARERNKRFVLVPLLTALKIVWADEYGAAGPQAELIETMRADPGFAWQETTRLLIAASDELNGPVRPSRVMAQVRNWLRPRLLRIGIHPLGRRPGRRRGWLIRRWRRERHLDPN